ncbi:Peroxisomal-coenzyme A synthetase [Mycena chlorophos]|uniref:Peroxisomal-coenzyme A synthetase n=1 Tax=Mycena chlorophos TaxID=658473 RepID=A0A8H6RYZ0_MYCCL|nr:Peroxisomal-coenzyme A synthetase [Mycena chlorophos]
MAIPLDFLRGLPQPSSSASLGDVLASSISSSHVASLLDCLPATTGPVLFSPDLSRPPLTHDALRSFVQHFALPISPPLGPNERVMVALPTGPENALALLSLAAYHTAAPVNAACTSAELLDDARRLRARVIFTTRDAETRLELPRLSHELGCAVVFLEPRTNGPCGLFDMSVMGAPSQPPHQPTKLHGLSDQSLILHTSGTSGKKKVVPYSLLSLIVGTWAVVQSWDLREPDINLNMMPLFHVGGIVRNLLAPVFSGGSAIVCAGFDAMAFWTLARDLQASWYYAAPTIHHAILTSQPEGMVPSRDLRIRMIANAAGGLLPSLAVSLKSTFEAVILPSYGMTECMPIASPPITYQLERPGCSGIACGPHMSIRDSGDLERELPRGRTGAICVRGLPTFEGYETEPGKPLDTSTFTSEGWFDSGDCGHMDEDGYLFITGRSKEIINKGGEVVSPFEVEEAIVTAAKGHVKTTLAFAIEHDVLQETIGVVIVPVPGRPRIGLGQLLDLLKDHLHPSKWPFAVVYMEDVPKNQAGKPLRIKLATRLNIGKLDDTVPVLSRHYEAVLPADQGNLAVPIPCQNVHVDYDAVDEALRTVSGVSDAALRVRPDRSLEAFVCTNGPDASEVADALKRVLPGYAVPSTIHHVAGEDHVPKNASGEPDFGAMEKIVARANAATMTDQARTVRDIIGTLLLSDPSLITPDADFFLLGGNSLLLGKLAYQIRRQTGVAIGVQALFANSTIQGIASMIETEHKRHSSSDDSLKEAKHHKHNLSARQSEATLNMGYDYDDDFEVSREKTRGQAHPLTMFVQLFPAVFFYPLKTALTWTVLLLMLSVLAPFITGNFWERIAVLMAAITVARLVTRIIAPVTSILFKWIVIGKYKPGTYPMWSTYYLRWWLVNQSIRVAGRGVFSMHPSLEILYYRLLGAHIGRNVTIQKGARLGEYDLLTFRDGCRVDGNTLIRGFCVEREGCFRLDPIVIGERALVNTYTQVAPGSVIPDHTVYGPHSSARDHPVPRSYAAFNRTLMTEPNFFLKLFIAWPVIFLVIFISYLPWFTAIWLMVKEVKIFQSKQLNSLEAVVYWFSSPERVAYHALSRIVRAALTPLLRLVFAILVKRLFGLNKEMATADMTQWMHLRRYINSTLLSKGALKSAFSILGTHYEIVSVVYRCMGAKVGKRVYWPGSGIYCPDPELLEIGNDVVFGSRSEVFTTDRIGSARVTVGDGAMIADRCVLLPGCKVGRRTVMGSGALGMRDADYKDGSTWLGTDCLDKGSSSKQEDMDTTTPFGRAFYRGEADYWVMPYWLILTTNILVASLSAAYWSISAVAAAQILRLIHREEGHRFHMYRADWYRPGYLYAWVALSFVIVLNLQAVLALAWVVVSKWAVIGQRRDGRYSWDKSSYCQRWQLHLTMSRLLYKGYGNGGVLAPLTGSVYIVWYFRALGAKIGKNVALYPGGKTGLMTEPDLVRLGDNVNLDDCSVVAHINSRGNFALNSLRIGNGCALRTGSRLLSGASMEDSSMLLEHTLMTSGDVADAGTVYSGWPAKPVDDNWHPRYKDDEEPSGLICPLCRNFPKDMTSTPCGHIFCNTCITETASTRKKCPVCTERVDARDLSRVYPSFAL